MSVTPHFKCEKGGGCPVACQDCWVRYLHAFLPAPDLVINEEPTISDLIKEMP